MPPRRPASIRDHAFGLMLPFMIALCPMAVQAATATTTLPVSMTITAGCMVSATPVAFGTQATLGSATTATGSLSVTCTNTTPYNVGLDAGGGSGATITVRKMTGPSAALISYSLFQNSALTTNFGNTVGTDTITGTGSAQSISAYGRVPAQTSPAPGAYADVVNVTVTGDHPPAQSTAVSRINVP